MAGQDYKRLIPAGGAFPLETGGDYIFLKFADRPIDVIVNGGRGGQTRITMEEGDKYRPGAFEALEFQNPDPDRPAQVVVTVGEGDYNRQIVKGEISVEPILRNADGTTKPDTRYDLAVSVNPLSVASEALASGDQVGAGVSDELGNTPTQNFISFGPNRTIYIFSDANNTNYLTTIYDRDTLAYQGVATGLRLGYAPGGPVAVTYVPGQGWLYLTDVGQLYRCNPGGGKTDSASYSNLGNFAGDAAAVRSMIYNDRDQELYIYATGADNNTVIRVLDTDLALVREIQTTQNGNNGTWLFDEFDRIHTHARTDGTGGMNYWEYDEAGAFGRTFNVGGLSYEDDDNFQCAIRYREYLYITKSWNPAQVRQYVYEGFTPKPELAAVRPGCEFRSVLMGYTTPNITANITATVTLSGVELSGEVIKAAIEYYFRRRAPADYLDHVYALDSNTTGFMTTGSGNRTFAAANIDDNFTVTLPGKLVLKLDQELELGAQL